MTERASLEVDELTRWLTAEVCERTGTAPEAFDVHARLSDYGIDSLEAISAGRKQQGMEHWLPLFHTKLETIFDYVGGAPITLDHQTDETHVARLALIADYYDARVQARALPKTSATLSSVIDTALAIASRPSRPTSRRTSCNSATRAPTGTARTP